MVVAHTLARWRMPMVRPDCPYTWVVPLVGLGSTLGGERGRAELSGRRTSLLARKCMASGLVQF